MHFDNFFLSLQLPRIIHKNAFQDSSDDALKSVSQVGDTPPEAAHSMSGKPNASGQTVGGPQLRVSRRRNGQKRASSMTPEDEEALQIREDHMETTSTRSESVCSDSSSHITVTSNVLNFARASLIQGTLELKDGLSFSPNDHIFLVSEPPGEPYYLARIMEFMESEQSHQTSQATAVRVNWYYRPRDISRSNADPRLLFASMHSDICPITAIRGKCSIKHKDGIQDLDVYKKMENSFWFEKLYDRYIHRFYDVVSTESIINLPASIKDVLRSRWRYAIAEPRRTKELTMQTRRCKRCNEWCGGKDSVKCGLCKSDYHMECTNPPLQKKPAKGFAFTCGPCSKAEARSDDNSSPLLQDAATESNSDNGSQNHDAVSGSSIHSIAANTDMAAIETACKVSTAKLWPYRYVGMHCRLEDIVDNDDRIYPRAASRLGVRHQAQIKPWPGRKVQYFEPRKYQKLLKSSRTRNSRQDNHTIANALRGVGSVESYQGDSEDTSEEMGPWMQLKPAGYIARGNDSTSVLLFAKPDDVREETVDGFVSRLEPICEKLGLKPYSTNLLDYALNALFKEDFDQDSALELVKKFTRRSIGEPNFSTQELYRFEEGVKKYGNELLPVQKEVRTKAVADVVLHYYLWKWTARGREFWGNFAGRGLKKDSSTRSRVPLDPNMHDDLGDSGDDSAYDSRKLTKKGTSPRCKFCGSTRSRRWRKAPLVLASQDGNIVALCEKCANLWRNYGIEKSCMEDVVHDTDRATEKNRKRKPSHPQHNDPDDMEFSSRRTKGRKKRQKSCDFSSKKQDEPHLGDSRNGRKICVVCSGIGDKQQLVECQICALIVHKGSRSSALLTLDCYGIPLASVDTWICDPCVNDRAPKVALVRKYSLNQRLTEELQVCLMSIGSKRGMLVYNCALA